MTDKGVTPSRPRPNPGPASPERPKTYADYPAAAQLNAFSLVGKHFQDVLAEKAAARAAAEPVVHVRAA